MRHNPASSLANNLRHVDESVLLQEQRLQTVLEAGAAEAVRPAHGVDVGLLVEVVAVLADVVQGGVDGGVIPAPTLVRHPAIPLTADEV